MKNPFYILALFFFILNCSSSDDSSDTNTTPCNAPSNITTDLITANSVTVNWGSTVNSASFNIEYGASGFVQGQGQKISTTGTSKLLTNLTENTEYQYYLRTDCGNNNFSSLVGPQSFTTLEFCPTPIFLNYETIYCSLKLNWSSEVETDFQIEYGASGFTLGTGTIISPTYNFSIISGNNLLEHTSYDFYIRAYFENIGFSEYSDVLVFTPTESSDLVGSYDVTVTQDDGTVFNHGIETIELVSDNTYKTQTTGGWAIGTLEPDQGFNFHNGCNILTVSQQQLFQYSYDNTVVGAQDGQVLSNGDLEIFYEIEFPTGNITYEAIYIKQ